MEMSEIGLVVVCHCPVEGEIVFDGEGVNFIKGLKVVEVGQKEIRGEGIVHADMDVPSELKESTFTCVRQEMKFKVLVTQFSLLNPRFLSPGENPAVIPSS